jgi:phage tail-like protein
MDSDRTLRVIADLDQWARCSHRNTALLEDGGVELSWTEPDRPPAGADPVSPAGLAFDRWCRGYRSWPEQGRVEALATGDETGARCGPGLLHVPRGLAVDSSQRLYVAESAGPAVHVIDLWGQRLLRRVPIGGARHPQQRPLDAAARRCDALVLLTDPAALVVVEGRRGPTRGPRLRRPRCARGLTATRVTAYGDDVLVLWTGRHRRAVLADPTGRRTAVVRDATDVELVGPGHVVVARQPGQGFRRLRAAGLGWVDSEPWAAPGYDGGAIALGPDGRIAYTTAAGYHWAGGSGATRLPSGRVVTYRLDAGAYRTRWGRVFLDACLPDGTDVRIGFVTTDDDTVDDPLRWTPADRGGGPVRSPDLTPPLPSIARLEQMPAPTPLFRRPEGREWAWAQIAADDRYETYESPVRASPGRYLWLVLDLSGTARATPRVRGLRVEAPGHRLLSQLPRSFSRAEADADFLQRYLAPAEGVLRDLDARAALRAVLLDPAATPQEALAWLAGFVGLVLDRRWPEPARRRLVAEAFDLFRVRGTARCLEELLGIYLDRAVTIVDNWRLRGLAGTVLGRPTAGDPAPSVRGGLRAGGQLGGFTVGGTIASANGYTATAHRFTVLIPTALDGERRAVVRDVVEQHKPAHTLMELCELGDGMRLGRSTRLDLASYVGPGAGFGPAVVGQVLVGADGVVGLPAVGSRVGEASLCEGVRVG